MNIKELLKMKLFDQWSPDKFSEITRVPGGWIHRSDTPDSNDSWRISSVFIPEPMTKREQFAAMAMQGMLSNSGRDGSGNQLTESAVLFADALIVELEK